MEQQTGKTSRKPRADGLRNRERLLESARQVFAAANGEAGLDAVARHAGVGIGTLYRHFPTREALFEAVYRQEVEELAALAEQLMKNVGPVEALRRWLRAHVELVARKKGMIAALALAAHNPADLYAYSFGRLTSALDTLMTRAVAEGAIRTDIAPGDVLRTLIGMCVLQEQPGWQEGVLRLVDVLVDGLQVAPTAR